VKAFIRKLRPEDLLDLFIKNFMPKYKMDNIKSNIYDGEKRNNSRKQHKIKLGFGIGILLNFLRQLPFLLRMIRPQGMISPLCACFAGIYLANLGFPSYIAIIISFILIILLWFGGVILNDYYDYEVDSITKSHRLIPSGEISRSEVLSASVIIMFTAFLLSLYISIKLSIIVSMIILLAVLYNSTFKKRGLIGNLSYGIITGLSFLIGVFVVDAFNQALLFITISIILLHTSVNMIGAIKDIEGDKKTGNWTVPAKYGMNATAQLAIFFLLLSLIMAYIPGILNLLDLRYMPTLIIIVIWLLYITILVKNEHRLGSMALGMYEMGASIYYINFITGI